jgi:hypothetical protein
MCRRQRDHRHRADALVRSRRHQATSGFGEHIYEHGLVGLIEQVDNDND